MWHLLSDSLSIVQAMYAVVGKYPKRIALFEEIQKDLQNENESEDYKVLRSKATQQTYIGLADVCFQTFYLRCSDNVFLTLEHSVCDCIDKKRSADV